MTFFLESFDLFVVKSYNYKYNDLLLTVWTDVVQVGTPVLRFSIFGNACHDFQHQNGFRVLACFFTCTKWIPQIPPELHRFIIAYSEYRFFRRCSIAKCANSVHPYSPKCSHSVPKKSLILVFSADWLKRNDIEKPFRLGLNWQNRRSWKIHAVNVLSSLSLFRVLRTELHAEWLVQYPTCSVFGWNGSNEWDSIYGE